MEQEKVLYLYDTYCDEVYRTAYSYLMNSYDAQDIVQEVFLKLLEKQCTALPGKESAFLTRITINCCKDALRKNKYRQHLPLDEDVFPAGTCFPQRTELAEALYKLAPKYRVVLYLYYYMGYTPPEIAKVCGITQSGVSMRMTRARKQLKSLLGEKLYDDNFL